MFGVGTPEVPERNPIDLVLILDRSGSMSGTPWTKAKEAAKIIVDLILPQDRCAVIDFSDSATLRQGLTSDKELLKQVISSLGSGGGTSIHAGIARGIQLIDSVNDTDRQRVFMLLSDGESNESSALAQANSAAEKGITIFTLGLGGVNERLLKNNCKHNRRRVQI
ncbi:vWA domain-containing protein [Acetivibrio clariflavus]|uniref:vWA domain-containing protein n=1 Tax=Acetivibrio clariflavus TaxID=288965 RepID=UPI0004898AD3|nr:vWA domain-containing protein [Acetivibrio clariflavus]